MLDSLRFFRNESRIWDRIRDVSFRFGAGRKEATLGPLVVGVTKNGGTRRLRRPSGVST